MATSRDVLLIALGSAGDVHPFVGIGRELQARGHRVVIATNPMFEELVTGAGFELVALGTREDYLRITENPDLWHPMKAFRLVAQFGFLAPMRPVYELIRERYVPGKTVVAATGLALGARVAQERLGVPLATLQMAPAVFRSEYQAPKLPGAYMPDSMPRLIKRGLYWVVDALVVDRILAPGVNAFRREVGLEAPVVRIMKDWWLSPERVIGLFPPFFMRPQPDWPGQVRLTSFPLYDGRGVQEVPAALEAFLREGPPPVVFTPGSANRHARDVFEKGAAACAAAGRRGILLSPFPENVPGKLPAGVRQFGYAPLSQILPRCAALVSHGGIGTVAQGLAAGVPQVVTPMAHDQFDNAQRIANLGVGEWRTVTKISEQWLAGALGRLLESPAVAQRCAACKAELARHDGVRETADLIEVLGQ